jgi:dTDP-4-dehydrorhamnose 3,5-epimerase
MFIENTSISGVFIYTSDFIMDTRGSFGRTFCQQSLRSILGLRNIQQINLSKSHKIGTVRGMHYQHEPFAEMKIIRCLKGRVFDVAVDLRIESPTYLAWFGVELSPASANALVIPEGCAHGFQVLDRDSELLYLHTAPYNAAAEGAVRYDDPKIGIRWPLSPTELSLKDRNHQLLP